RLWLQEVPSGEPSSAILSWFAAQRRGGGCPTRGTLRKDNIDLQMAKGGRTRVTDHCVTQSAAIPPPAGALFHVPAVAPDYRLPRQRVRWKSGEEQRHLGDVGERGELAVHRVLEHHVPDHFLFSDSQISCLFRDLPFYQRRAHEPWTDRVRTDAEGRAFFGDRFAKADQTVLRRHIRRFERRRLLRV